MIDTHIHIDEDAYAADREEVIARQREAGVEAMIVPGVNAKSIEGILDVCRRHKGYCFPALGFHPQDVFPDDYKEQWRIIEEAIRAHRKEIVAIGEIGLDYHYDTTYKEGQQDIFKRQLDLAQELDLPVMIHNRDATEDTLRILKSQISNHNSPITTAPLRGVVHCFNGSQEVAKQILDMGLYFGIGGVLTFKNCKLYETLEVVPLDRIVLETDGPYLAPTPHRGERNESRLMIFVVQRLAEVYHTTPEKVISITSANAKKLFFA
jgi:TatD DNase family protein